MGKAISDQKLTNQTIFLQFLRVKVVKNILLKSGPSPSAAASNVWPTWRSVNAASFFTDQSSVSSVSAYTVSREHRSVYSETGRPSRYSKNNILDVPPRYTN